MNDATSRGTIVFALGFIVVWSVFAGVVMLSPVNTVLVATFGQNGFAVLFTLLKLPVWILPVVLFLRHAGIQDRRGLLGLDRPRLVAIAVGIVLALVWFNAHAMLVSGRAPRWPVPAAVVLALVTPLVEELFFRGAVLGLLARVQPFLRANVIQAALFLLLHLPWWTLSGLSGAAILQRSLYIAALGFFLGYLRRWTGGLLAPLLVHWANNLGGRL